MKATCTTAASGAYQPIAVTILLETQQDAEAFRTLVSRNVTIPNLVEDKFYGNGSPSAAREITYDLLGDLQRQLNSLGFGYPRNGV